MFRKFVLLKVIPILDKLLIFSILSFLLLAYLLDIIN